MRKALCRQLGVPPVGGVNLVADWVAGGIAEKATSPSTGRQDLNLDSALCFRALQDEAGAGRERARLAEFCASPVWNAPSADERSRAGRPAIVIGRQDALVFPNLHSRAYYALNQEREGRESRMSYIEVTPGSTSVRSSPAFSWAGRRPIRAAALNTLS